MSLLATIESKPASESSIVDQELRNDAGTSLSLYSARDMIAGALSELKDRSMKDPYFRESLVNDPRITIESLLTHSAGYKVSIPDFVELSVYQNTAETSHLVVPTPEEGTHLRDSGNNALLAILKDASRDIELRDALVENPKATLERELIKRMGEGVEIPENVDIRVLQPGANEVIIVLPSAPLSRASESLGNDADFAFDKFDLQNFNDTTAFTDCSSSCGTGCCPTTPSYGCR